MRVCVFHIGVTEGKLIPSSHDSSRSSDSAWGFSIPVCMVFVLFFSKLRNDGYFVRGESNRKDIDQREVVDADLTCEPVWPSGQMLG